MIIRISILKKKKKNHICQEVMILYTTEVELPVSTLYLSGKPQLCDMSIAKTEPTNSNQIKFGR